jgi:hypothetical protein
MDKQTKVMDTVEMNFTPEASLEKPIEDLFNECLSFISVASFEI